MVYMIALAFLFLASLRFAKSTTPKPIEAPSASISEAGSQSTISHAVEQFLSTPLQDIALADVPAVGPKTLRALERHNIKTAEQLFGYFLYQERHEDAVRGFLRDDMGLHGATVKRLYDSMITKADRLCEMGGRGYGSLSAGKLTHQPSSTMSTSTAHEYFMSTPLQDIALDQVPGVGDKTLPKLRQASISSAEALFGYFLYVGRDEENFRDWLKADSIGVRGAEAKKVHDAMRDKADLLCALGGR